MKHTRRVPKRKAKTSQPTRPYMKTSENKGLYDPQERLETAQSSSMLTAANSGFSFLNSFGGFDGIMSMVGKAQQMFRLFQQMGPLFKMFNSFGGAGAAKALTANLRESKRRKQSRRRKAY
jgi:hypothetical protein